MNDDPSYFYFKHFRLRNRNAAFKVNTDGVMLGAWAELSATQTACDIGTGTGVIALMLVQRFPSLTVHAIDIDEQSVNEASFNFEINSKRVFLHHTDVNDWKPPVQFDHIICNPPYFESGTLPKRRRLSKAKHASSLTANQFWQSMDKLAHHCTKVSLVLPADNLERWTILAKARAFKISRICHVSSRKNQKPIRCLVEFTHFFDGTKTEDQMYIIEGGRKDWSEKYKSLTKEFYLDS